MKKIFVLALAVLMMGNVNAMMETCDLGVATVCNQHGWGEDPGIGYYGNRAMGDFDLVVEPGVCDSSTWRATVDFSGGTLSIVALGAPWTYCTGYGQLAVSEIRKDGNTIYIDHLDGSADDSFDVYWNDQLICHYTDQYSHETWLTTECDIPYQEAPEFGSLTMALAILLTTPAFAYLIVKKRQ